MYKYKLRPGYGSEKFLIDFFYGAENDNFISGLLSTIKELQPEIITISDVWVNDEILMNMTSTIGKFIISKDSLGFAFITADDNQDCLLKINTILENSINFEKVEADFEDYRLK